MCSLRPSRRRLRNENRLILVFTGMYLAAFTVISLYFENLEFVYYTVLIGGIVIIYAFLHRYLFVGPLALAALSVVALLHVMGGNLHVDGTRLYDVLLFGGPFHFDNLVHGVGFIVVAVVVYDLIGHHLDKYGVRSSYIVLPIVVLMSMGFGALIEIVEYGAVLFFNAAERVGGYENNALDLVFNFIGCLIGGAGIGVHRHLTGQRKRGIARVAREFNVPAETTPRVQAAADPPTDPPHGPAEDQRIGL